MSVEQFVSAKESKNMKLRDTKDRGRVKKRERSVEGDETHEQTNAQEDGVNPEKPIKKSRKGEMADVWAKFMAEKQKGNAKQEGPGNTTTTTHTLDHTSALAAIRLRIASDTSMTQFRRRVLILLTQVPRGRYTTYKALSIAMAGPTTSNTSSVADSLPSTSTSCARAVGSAMRRNPFAPLVPCHRVLAADGRIGGFKGDWGEEGRFTSEKRKLLRDEGVKFDGSGKVVGEPFAGFMPVDVKL